MNAFLGILSRSPLLVAGRRSAELTSEGNRAGLHLRIKDPR